jgi:hypothetical protein
MNWKDKALRATKQTQLGAILRCALQVERSAVPRFTSKAVITSDGYIQANFVDRDGVTRHMAFVGDVASLKDNVVGLAKHLKLSETERSEIFTTFKDWIITDYSGKGIGL